MKITILQKIFDSIQQDIACPKCKRSFFKKDMKIVDIQDGQVELTSYCRHCQLNARILAKIKEDNVPRKKIRRCINPQDLRQIKQLVKCFEGLNVSDLFRL